MATCAPQPAAELLRSLGCVAAGRRRPAARDHLGEGWDAAWDQAPAWRFALPAGACGPDPVAGVMAPSADTVGRRFALTAAAILPGRLRRHGRPTGSPRWKARCGPPGARGWTPDALAALLPPPGAADPAAAPEPGWWTAGSADLPGLIWPLAGLPEPSEFVLLLDAQA